MRDVLLPLAGVAVVAVVILLLAVTHPVLARLAVRNAFRRRTRVVVVTLGLLIGTAIIASSLTVGDTMEYIFTSQAYEGWDAIDVVVAHDVGGEWQNFPAAYFDTLRTEALARGARFDGMAPVLEKAMPIRNEDMIRGSQSVTVLGLDEAHEAGFGSLRTVDGATVTTDDLSPGWAYVNEAAAGELDAFPGNRLTLFFGTTNLTLVSLRVEAVVRDEGKALYQQRPLLFLPLEEAQTTFHSVGEINLVKVSAPGPVVGGEDGSPALAKQLRRVVAVEQWPLDVQEVKRTALEDARMIADQATQLFLVMGSFAILAGILLLVNLFVMLAEERKAEMGVSRAVGLKRTHLMMTFLFEGSLYAGLAAFSGAIVGLALGWLMVWIFNAVFPPELGSGLVEFHADPGSVLLAFAAGVLITVAAVAVASAAVSRLNIVRAIRNLPDPASRRLSFVERWLVFLTVVAGPILAVRGFGLLHLDLPSLDLSPLPWIAAIVVLGGLIGHLTYRLTGRRQIAAYSRLGVQVALAALFVLAAYDLLVLPVADGESVGAYRIACLPLLFLGLAVLVSRRVGPRAPFTLAAIGSLWWLLLPPVDLVDMGRDDVAVLFVEIGVLLVLAAILLTVFNTSPILRGILNRFARKGRPVVRMAASYPMRKKFRTGMTLAMFSLTIFSITIIAMVQGMESASLDKFIEGQTGGFEVIGYTTGYAPIENITDELVARNVSLDYFVGGARGVATASILSVRLNRSGEGDARNYTMWGVDNYLIERNTYGFVSHLDEASYVDGNGTSHVLALDRREDVWEALRLNRSFAVADRSAAGFDQFTPDGGGLTMAPGDRVVATDEAGNAREFVVLGILEQSLQFTRGLFVDRTTVLDTFERNATRTAYFFQIAPGVDASVVREELEHAFFEYGFVTIDIRDLIQTAFSAVDRVLMLMQAYLALGLLVGIAGLGVITVRAVVERRQEIGTMRALGFTAKMVRNTFLLEIALICALGVVIGIALGIFLARNVYELYFASIAVFSIPWLHLAVIAAIAVVVTLLVTATPAVRASKMPPAESLRFVE